jgi:glucose/arabinose dehydrogenase
VRLGARATLGCLVVLCMMALTAADAAAEPALPEGFQDTVVLDHLEEPTNFRFAANGEVFVAEKPGKILLYENLEDTTPEVFADLRTDVYQTGDRGLLGIALDPKFTEGRPYVYALYTYDHILGDPAPPPKWGKPKTTGDPCPEPHGADACLVSGRLVRLTAEGSPPHAKLESEGEPFQEVLAEDWCQQFSSHSIGDLEFGPEGDLYVSGGDGASFGSTPDYGQLGEPPNPCGDPPTPKGVAPPAGTPSEPSPSRGGSLRAQNLENLSGKILRVDSDTGEGATGNPLAASANANTRRIIAEGFRNPFRFTLDPKTGELYTDNVGSSQIEEIDRFAAPPTGIYNSGWPCYEGPGRQFQFRTLFLEVCEGLYEEEEAGAEPTADPFFYYSHGQSVVPEDECPIEYGSALGGISFYEGKSNYPSKYDGALFITDTVRGCVYVIRPDSPGEPPDPLTAERFMRESRIYPAVDIEEGPEGNLYYADLFGNEEGAEGAIHRITYQPGAPTARLTANPPYGSSLPLKITFDASESTAPGEEPLTYEWDLNGDGTFEKSGGEKQTLEFTKSMLEEEEEHGESLNQVVAVRVTDAKGGSVARVTVYPGDDPPEPKIIKPLVSQKWKVGEKVELLGLALDSEYVTPEHPNGEIYTPLSYYWSTRILHCPTGPTTCHTHPLQIFAGTRSGELFAPEHDYPSYLEITLRVADERGLTASKTIKLEPRTVNLDVRSVPPGVELTAGLAQGPSPLSVTAIEGSHLVLAAPGTAQLEGITYAFSGWSDGGTEVHTITANSSSTYTANYTRPPVIVPPHEEPPPKGPSPPPLTQLRKHPPKSTSSTAAKFVFGADSAGATFTCKLDGKAKAACRSPKTYKGLKPGKHTFKVWATAGGTADTTPAKFSWKIVAPKH